METERQEMYDSIKKCLDVSILIQCHSCGFEHQWFILEETEEEMAFLIHEGWHVSNGKPFCAKCKPQ